MVDIENSIITIRTETGDQQIRIDPDHTHVLLLDDDGNESDDGSLSVAIDLSGMRGSADPDVMPDSAAARIRYQQRPSHLHLDTG